MKKKLKVMSILAVSYFSLPSYALCQGSTMAEVLNCVNNENDKLEALVQTLSGNLNTLRAQTNTQDTSLTALTQTVTTQGQQQTQIQTQLQTQIQTAGQSANNYADNEILKTVPAGTVVAFAGPNIPDGWLVCSGAEVSQGSYPKLFQAIGNTYGTPGNGSDFLLPDYRGLFLRGASQNTGTNDPDMASRTAYKAGASTGGNVGSYQTDMFAAHSHTSTLYYFSSSTGLQMSGTDWSYTMPGGKPYTAQTTSVGGSETRPKNVNVYYIIKE